MLDRYRLIFLSLTSLGFAFAISSISSALADPPTSTESRIRRALQGEINSQPAADGILNDVIDVIKKRGSVLDGTVLDDRMPVDSVLSDDQPAPPNADSETDAAMPSAIASGRALVAEQLLKASRMLESIGTHDRSRHLLIRQMRREAAELLSE